MEFGLAEHSESLFYPYKLLSLQVHRGLSLFDLTQPELTTVFVCDAPPSTAAQNVKDKKTEKMKSAVGHFSETLTRMGINGGSTESHAEKCKFLV